MKKSITLLFSLFLILPACSPNGKVQEEKSPELLEVSIKTAEHITTNQETTIEATVTQGNEEVTAADEVKFEILKADEEGSETIQAKHTQNGVYSIKKTFTESGRYVVIAHVTANSMHAMPKTEFSVDPGASEQQAAPAEQHTEGSHDHHPSKVKFDLQVEGPLQSQQPILLKVTTTQDNQPVTDARVRFEIWEADSSQHDFHDTIEGSNGEYSLTHTFPKPGKYIVNIHTEKGELHEHSEKLIELK